jgi:hypothetical protein
MTDNHKARHEVLRLLPNARRAPEQPFPGGASDQELADLERRLGTPLPAALTDWLHICKGEAICAGGVFGARPDQDFLDIAAYSTLHPQWKGLGWLPVAGDGCGNYYVLLTTGQVAFIDTMSDPDAIDHIAGEDLWTFLHSLLTRD